MEPGISSEKKLQLARKIREEHQMNQNTLRGREAILYGKSISPYYELHAAEFRGPEEGIYSTLRIRFALALLLFFGFFILESRGESIFGVGAEQVYQAVETDYSANMFDFMQKIPYNLDDTIE